VSVKKCKISKIIKTVCDGSVFSAAVRPKTATRQSRADCRGAAIYVTDEKIQNFSGNHVGTARDGLGGASELV
jgi:hypothetical protein